ncbi:MAG TPA: CDP-alcohol phosphatidyltransferase family protein [Methylomirabilota bacterium]|nr:CDP-alcohol phosphatidyltransferase family protein [Methylomirabilota bacterium]
MLGHYKEHVDRLADPVARALVHARVRPNQLSLCGLVASCLAALTLALGYPRPGGLLLAVAGALDILDGAVARAARQTSAFGAFLDSVLDRYSDLLVLGGVIVLFARRGAVSDLVIGLLALAGTVMVSYTRARAESVGVECRVGIMERGERLLTLIAGALLDLLAPAMWLLAVGANATAVHRIVHTWRATRPVSTGRHGA